MSRRNSLHPRRGSNTSGGGYHLPPGNPASPSQGWYPNPPYTNGAYIEANAQQHGWTHHVSANSAGQAGLGTGNEQSTPRNVPSNPGYGQRYYGDQQYTQPYTQQYTQPYAQPYTQQYDQQSQNGATGAHQIPEQVTPVRPPQGQGNEGSPPQSSPSLWPAGQGNCDLTAPTAHGSPGNLSSSHSTTGNRDSYAAETSPSQRNVTGFPGPLRPDFRPRDPSFFVVGRLLSVEWVETNGNDCRKASSAHASERYTDPTGIHCKISRMLVVNRNRECCTCLPVNTYGGRGVTKPGIRLGKHAPILTLGTPSPAQTPGLIDTTLWVEPSGNSGTLNRTSLVNFEKAHTVEYYSPVKDLGCLDPKSTEGLRSLWRFHSASGY